jgi:hypothetical protein
LYQTLGEWKYFSFHRFAGLTFAIGLVAGKISARNAAQLYQFSKFRLQIKPLKLGRNRAFAIANCELQIGIRTDYGVEE